MPFSVLHLSSFFSFLVLRSVPQLPRHHLSGNNPASSILSSSVFPPLRLSFFFLPTSVFPLALALSILGLPLPFFVLFLGHTSPLRANESARAAHSLIILRSNYGVGAGALRSPSPSPSSPPAPLELPSSLPCLSSSDLLPPQPLLLPRSLFPSFAPRKDFNGEHSRSPGFHSFLLFFLSLLLSPSLSLSSRAGFRDGGGKLRTARRWWRRRRQHRAEDEASFRPHNHPPYLMLDAYLGGDWAAIL